MPKFKSKILIFGLIISFFLVSMSIPSLLAQIATGNLTGYVYEKDGKTPVKNAIVKIKNITTGQEFESEPTDETGAYKIMNIPVGVYLIGVVVGKEKYNINALVEIKEKETAKLSVILIKKKALVAGIFPLPCFVASLVGGGGVIYKLVKKKEEVSPIK